MKNPLVSFIVNCYNGEEFLERALKSIISQTYSNWELIFWDNCSTDNSKKIFESFDNDKFKYFYSKSNVSLGQARAWAVEKCNGEYIAFLDVDDEWYPEKTKIQIEIMINDSSVLSYSDIKEIDENKKSFITKTLWHTGYIFSNQLRQFEINLPSAMINRSVLLKKNLNFDPKIQASEEYCLFMQLIYKERVSVIKKVLAKYYIRRNSLTNQKSHLWSSERKHTLNLIIKNNPLSIKYYRDDFSEAFARAEYYKVRHLVFEKKYFEAKAVMKNIAFKDFKYFVLFIILSISIKLWNYVHEFKSKRG